MGFTPVLLGIVLLQAQPLASLISLSTICYIPDGQGLVEAFLPIVGAFLSFSLSLWVCLFVSVSVSVSVSLSLYHTQIN